MTTTFHPATQAKQARAQAKAARLLAERAAAAGEATVNGAAGALEAEKSKIAPLIVATVVVLVAAVGISQLGK